MNIYLTRHGETDLNKAKLMQGLTDEPLNEVGIFQAGEAKKNIEDVRLDAVFSSPLKRAVQTASIIGNISEDKILKDERLLEVDFGKYELKPYGHLGLKMTLYWACPQIFKCPESVEDTKSMVRRAESFLLELKEKKYENVLIVCHGGIIRAFSGCLEGRKNGLKWRPRPKNCEIRKYEI